MSRKPRKLSKQDEIYYNTVIAELPMLHDGSGSSWMKNPLPPEEASASRVGASGTGKRRETQRKDGGAPVIVDNNGSHVSYHDDPYTTYKCSAFSLFFHKIWWGFLFIITLGIAYPWIVCKRERFFAKRTKINGHQLKFEGRGASLFGHYMLWYLFTILTLGIFAFWLEKKILNWKAARMNFEGANEDAAGGYNGSAILLALLRLAWILLSIVTAFIMFPKTRCWQARYILRHTRYKGRQLNFDGRGIQLFGRYLLCGLLFTITLGIYGFWIPNKMHWWYTVHTIFIDVPRR